MLYSFQSPAPWVPTDGTSVAEAIVSDKYFFEKFLGISGGLFDINGYQPWIAFAFIVLAIVNFLIIYEGIDTSKYTVYVLVPLPYLLMTVLLLKGLTLEGNYIGWMYLITPDWSKLFTLQIWADACSQVLFSAGLAHNTIMKFGTHKNQDDKILGSSIAVPLLNFATSFFAALALFAFIGHASLETGVAIKDMPLKGMSLAFVVYPTLLSTLPFAQFWSILFFFMLTLLGLGTEYVFIECVSKMIFGFLKRRGGFNRSPTFVTF